MVAKIEKDAVGHILFYPIRIKTEAEKRNSLELARISVNPDRQRKGIGSGLIRRLLTTAKRLGFHSMIVLGHSSHCTRFGLKPANGWNTNLPFNVAGDVFATGLTKNGLDTVRVTSNIQKNSEFFELNTKK